MSFTFLRVFLLQVGSIPNGRREEVVDDLIRVIVSRTFLVVFVVFFCQAAYRQNVFQPLHIFRRQSYQPAAQHRGDHLEGACAAQSLPKQSVRKVDIAVAPLHQQTAHKALEPCESDGIPEMPPGMIRG